MHCGGGRRGRVAVRFSANQCKQPAYAKVKNVVVKAAAIPPGPVPETFEITGMNSPTTESPNVKRGYPFAMRRSEEG